MPQYRSKGIIFSLTVGSVATAITQMSAVSPPGWKSESYESHYLEQSGAGKQKDMTGWAESSEFSASLFWDPTLAAHIAILAKITTPTKGLGSITLPATPIFVDGTGGSTSTTAAVISFTVADMELTPKAEMGKAVTADLKGSVSGLATVS